MRRLGIFFHDRVWERNLSQPGPIRTSPATTEAAAGCAAEAICHGRDAEGPYRPRNSQFGVVG
jgi:hypothetical protein